jgi:hypothetical protein
MAKVQRLHDRVADLDDALRRSKAREHDLLELLAKWSRTEGG